MTALMCYLQIVVVEISLQFHRCDSVVCCGALEMGALGSVTMRLDLLPSI
jgi:hypothetical protein